VESLDNGNNDAIHEPLVPLSLILKVVDSHRQVVRPPVDTRHQFLRSRREKEEGFEFLFRKPSRMIPNKILNLRRSQAKWFKLRLHTVEDLLKSRRLDDSVDPNSNLRTWIMTFQPVTRDRIRIIVEHTCHFTPSRADKKSAITRGRMEIFLIHIHTRMAHTYAIADQTVTRHFNISFVCEELFEPLSLSI